MKLSSIHFSLVFALLAVLFISCQREIKSDNPGTIPGTVVNPTPVTGNLTGKVIDESNNAVSGATVKSGSNTVTTDSRGLFRFDNIQSDKFSAMVTVEKNGYFKAIRTFSATANSTNFVKLKLLPKTLSGNIDAATGGSVNLPDNSRVTISAGSVVVKLTNQPYTGSIKVYVIVIDPTSADIAQIVPGSFQANDANNYRVTLKSFGMLAVELEGSGGEALQIASGKTSKLRFTIPSSLRTAAPATIPLWSVDENTGLWKQENNATKTSDYYEGDVSHFSFWNCDISIPSVFLELTVVTVEGPLYFTKVKITRVNGGGSSYGYTDSSGHVGGIVPKNESLLLEILDNCNNPVISQNIGPFTANTNLGTITITLPALSTLQITGSAVNCTNQPVTNGSAIIYFEGHRYNKSITGGNFSLTVTRCSNSSAPVEVIVVDNTANQQGTAWTGAATTGIVNTGTLNACGTSTISFINYSLDGTSFSLSSATPGDSIMTYGNGSNTQNITSINGIRMGQANMKLYLYTSGAAVGTFPLQHLSVNQYDSLALIAPFNITFTAYGVPGQFIDGNFAGQFRDNLNNLHNISATFRVRRR